MRRRRLVTVLVTVMLTATAGIATAAAQHPSDADQEDATIEWTYVEEDGTLIWWFASDVEAGGFGDDPEPAEAVDCLGEEPAEEICHVVQITPPPGEEEPNHGTFVSAFVHSLSDEDLDMPRGWLVRQVAQSDLGKSGDDIEEAEELEVENEDDDGDGDGRRGPPDHVLDKLPSHVQERMAAKRGG